MKFFFSNSTWDSLGFLNLWLGIFHWIWKILRHHLFNCCLYCIFSFLSFCNSEWIYIGICPRCLLILHIFYLFAFCIESWMISSDLISSSLIFSLAEFNLLLKLSVVWNLIVQVLFGSFSNLIIFVIFHSFNPLFLLKFKYNYVAYLILWTYIYIRILITVFL